MSEASTTPSEQPPTPEIDTLDVKARIQLAINAISKSPLGTNGLPKLSICEACRTYNVKRGQLMSCLNGFKTRQQAHTHERALSEAEEEVLAEWTKTLGHCGTPVTLDMLREYASASLLIFDHISDALSNYTFNHQEIAGKKFYEMIKDLIEEYKIPVENIYNANKKGIQLGVGKSVSAIVDRNQKNVQQVENGNCEMVAIIETICADGTSLPLIMISENGWTDKELGSNLLSTSWKTLVNCLTHDGIPITKLNFLKHYHMARHKAFKPSTIISAFAKSGIWPLNLNAIPLEAYEPAKNTTTQAAMPISSDLTPLLETIEEESTSPNPATSTDTSETPLQSGQADLHKQIDQLRGLLDRTQDQMEENEHLRQILYHKESSKKKTHSSSNPRHMTGAENLDELAYAKWKGVWKATLKEARKAFKACRKLIEEAEKEIVQEKKWVEQEAKRQERDMEKKKDEEKLVEHERKKEERTVKAAEKAAATAAAKAEKEAAKAEKEAAKAAKEQERVRVRSGMSQRQSHCSRKSGESWRYRFRRGHAGSGNDSI
ncbi:hypothetical protein BDZ97DRAFT_1762169 [Flammula alnicola]|nr:hypothetical protein BDZ97DRAFT_1762169 [Flammula alnicola]